jgi:hypothetical protein
MKGLALGVALAACYQPNAVSGVPCAANGQCPGAQLCDFGHAPPICVNSLTLDAAMRDATPDARVDGRPMADAPGDASAPKVTLVQQATHSAVTGTPLSAVLPNLPTAGNMLVMVGDSPQAYIMSVTGGGVASWNSATGSFSACNSEIWYGVTDGSSATVTIADIGNTMEIWLNVSEWSGLKTAAPLDGATNGHGAMGAATVAPLTTAHASDLLIFTASTHVPNTYGAPAPGTWTALTPIQVGQCAQAEWYSVVGATGSYAPSATQTGGGWDAAIAAFEAAP